MIRLTPEVRLRRGPDDSCWAFRLDTGEHYELNETAFKVLEALGQNVEPAAIADELATEYGVTVSETETDVANAIETYVTEGLVNREA
jgi:hypothetical protein